MRNGIGSGIRGLMGVFLGAALFASTPGTSLAQDHGG